MDGQTPGGANKRLAMLRELAQEAMNDPLFVADMRDTMQAFEHVDREFWPAEELYTTASATDGTVTDEPFVGMWRDRDDMSDSTVWVKETRNGEWSHIRHVNEVAGVDGEADLPGRQAI